MTAVAGRPTLTVMAQGMATSPIDGILETTLYVDDLAAAERFYGDVLGLELDSRREGVFAFYRVGRGMLLLFDPTASRIDRGVPTHGAIGPGHACLAVSSTELEPWRQRLERLGVQIEHVQEWPRGGSSFYFRDPSGNSIEIAKPGIWGMAEHG